MDEAVKVRELMGFKMLTIRPFAFPTPGLIQPPRPWRLHEIFMKSSDNLHEIQMFVFSPGDMLLPFMVRYGIEMSVSHDVSGYESSVGREFSNGDTVMASALTPDVMGVETVRQEGLW